ncbi:putative Peptidase, trypsin-like serine and cysteine [Legionella santicrucis]|uniref:Putative Peptidase, trypsin-like serine and cysteine n=1 Tax=Legionella santicrucis TaxID=45074 RepID=A0A0W0Z2D4_9GAMM|nr:serine protease [Legionella santicrucis]KTD63290.1 putative Peptidase, trypsin-like serine and cysteine [Legionella santicrucis]
MIKRQFVGVEPKFSINNFESKWIKHPDPNVDLAALPIAGLLNQTTASGKKIFFMPIDDSLIPESEVITNLNGIEDIIMIGYPNGIWDQINNLPIVRRGITATNPKHDYNGLPVIIIDCACFPGSSGSPVLILNQGSYPDSKGNLSIGNRIIFLGVLYAGPQHEAEGEIRIIETPLQQVPISLSRIPNNLGFVVKSEKIKDFKSILSSAQNT